MTPKKILNALAAGAQGTITVAAACGVAGIIAGTITMTGLANMLINGITEFLYQRFFVFGKSIDTNKSAIKKKEKEAAEAAKAAEVAEAETAVPETASAK